MRVALVYEHGLGQGGYPRDIRWLAGAMARQGVPVTLFCSHEPQSTLQRDGLEPGVQLEPLERLAEREGDFAIVHVFGILLAAHLRPVVRLALRGQPPLVVSPLGQLMRQSMKVSTLKKEVFLRLTYHLVVRRITAFHLFSETEEADLRDRFPLTKRFVAPLGVYPIPGDATGMGTAPDSLTGDLHLLFFGRNDVHQKGIDILLEGFGKAVHCGARATLTIAGQSWKDSDSRIKASIERLGIQERVRIVGPTDEIGKFRLLREADYLIFLSRWDGPPRPIREAIAAGTPVIVSPETNMSQAVAAFGAGLTTALSLDDVALAISRAASDSLLWHDARTGVSRLGEHLQWDKVALTYIRAYESLCKEKTASGGRSL